MKLLLLIPLFLIACAQEQKQIIQERGKVVYVNLYNCNRVNRCDVVIQKTPWAVYNRRGMTIDDIWIDPNLPRDYRIKGIEF